MTRRRMGRQTPAELARHLTGNGGHGDGTVRYYSVYRDLGLLHDGHFLGTLTRSAQDRTSRSYRLRGDSRSYLARIRVHDGE